MERMSAQGTWKHEGFEEYADHSISDYNVPDDEIERAVAAIEGIRRTVARIEDDKTGDQS
jgi:hypothetical protein